MTMTFTRRTGASLAAGVMVLAAAGCQDLTVPNYQNPSPSSVTSDPLGTLQLEATAVLLTDRAAAPAYVLGLGILGRETFNYTATEPRNTTGWLTSNVNDQTSFGGSALWAAHYLVLRNIKLTRALVDSTPDGLLSPAQKNAARGFLHTMEALQLSYAISTRHNLGIVVEIKDDPNQLTPFVTRDSAYNYIAGILDLAKTELLAGGSTFPFTLHSGFTGYTTPANFLKFNRAIAARINAYRASLGVSGCGAAFSSACYQTALTNLAESFLPATDAAITASVLTGGVNRTYSSAANDLANALSNAASQNVVAHPSINSDFQSNGATPDARYTSKVLKLAAAKTSPADGIPTDYDFTIYSVRESPISIIRAEELLLLRAEARWYTGGTAGALTDVNLVRSLMGGLPAVAPATTADFVTALLYERRYSLVFEGHRWVDVRRFGRLTTLPLDRPSHVLTAQLPVPNNECLQRANAPANLKAQGCV